MIAEACCKMSLRRRQREASIVKNSTSAMVLVMTDDCGDATEAYMTGSDGADWAYGSAFYLQEEYLQRFRKRQNCNHESAGFNKHDDDAYDANDKNSFLDKDENSKGVKTAQLSNTDLFFDVKRRPPFFLHGRDFPPLVVPCDDSGDTDVADGMSATVTVVQDEKSDIIMPVVSSACRLAKSAVKGSAALVLLRQQQEVERATREVMDTSKSDLARLLRRGEDGRVQQLETRNNENDGGVWSAVGKDDSLAMEDDAEMLRRKVRKETRRLEYMMDTSSSAAVVAADGGEDEREENAIQRANVLRKRQEKFERLQDAKQRLTEESSHVEDYEAKRIALMSMQRRLPIYQCKEELLRCIGENPVSIIIGETGSGKTTQLVQYLYQRGYTRTCGGGIICCTQPRRLAAIGVARRVSEEMGCALGTRVGYTIHLDDNTSDETEIKFMTDGVLLREIVHDPDVKKYSVIIIDEAHERSINTDVLLGVLQAAVRRRSDLKLVVTSATMDILKFSKFFGNAPFYEIPGKTHNVDIQYTSAPVDDYVTEAVFRVCQLHLQMPLEGKHDILVFMTGRDDVLGTCELIVRRLRELDEKWVKSLLVIPCLSDAVTMTNSAIFDPAPPGIRKCIVATNVAETSLTIDGIRYVVDSGFMKTNVFRPKLGMNTLQRYPVSQAQANQRKGRAGRTTEGICYRLYTEAQFTGEMLLDSVPEIQRSSIDSVILLLKSIGVSKIIDFDFMDPPPTSNISRSMWQLWVLGFLDDNGAITADGRQALEFPLAPSLAKVLVESSLRDCSVEAVRVVSMISADPKALFELPKGQEETARQHHGRFYVNESDHLTLLNVMTHFIENGRSRQWARDNFLHAATLLRAFEVQQQLIDRMRQLKLPLVSCGSKGLDRVRHCVAMGFCLQAAARSSTNWSEYRPLLNTGVVCSVHPSSAICSRAEMPLYLVYNDLLFTTREYLVLVTAVERDWLIEASRGVFCAKGYAKDTKATAATPSHKRGELQTTALVKDGVPSEIKVGPWHGGAVRKESLAAQPTKSLVQSKRRQNI